MNLLTEHSGKNNSGVDAPKIYAHLYVPAFITYFLFVTVFVFLASRQHCPFLEYGQLIQFLQQN